MRSPAVAWLLLSLLACRPAGSPSQDVRRTVAFEPEGEGDLEAIDPADVAFFGKHDALPPGLEYDRYRGLLVAPNYPSPEAPHQLVGKLRLAEEVDGWGDAAEKDPALETEHHLAVRREAAQRGANAVIRIGSVWSRGKPGKHRASYLAVHLSDAAPSYPTAEALLASLPLPDGYRLAQRDAFELAQLPEAKLNVPLRRGHCYILALAFHPGEVRRPLKGRDKVSALGFRVEMPRRADVPDFNVANAGANHFYRWSDNQGESASWRELDGVWSRAGAGILKCPVVHNQTATVRFASRAGRDFRPGEGKAEIAVYDLALSPAQQAEKLCSQCWHKFEQCDPRRPLATCSELTQCLPSVGMSVGACRPVFKRP